MTATSISRSFVALLILLPQGWSLPVVWPDDSVYTSTKPRDLSQTFQVRVATLSCSCISMVASVVAFYWFCRMEKRFRHRSVPLDYAGVDANMHYRLIMVLVYGDLMRETWFFMYAVITLSRGTVKTESSFCQASGFLIQYGTETSGAYNSIIREVADLFLDYGVLVIAIHSALQVFLPGSQATSEGLYPYQRLVYTGALLIPALMAGLAFINKNRGYLSQGAFCTLPIRPFWYRLALTWIPRYLIAMVIICLAIAIYAYVAYKFRSYSEASPSFLTPYGPGVSMPQVPRRRATDPAAVTLDIKEPESTHKRRASSIAHDIVSSPRQAPSVSSTREGRNLDSSLLAPEADTRSLPGSSVHLPLMHSTTYSSPLSAIPSSDAIRSPDSTVAISNVASPGAVTNANCITLIQGSQPPGGSQSRSPSPNSSPSERHMARQRARIYRQLRLMFIYPLVYTLMWILPFIHHSMMYKDKYALQPVWPLRLGAYICMGSIGFVNCLIFSLRERPWNNIPTSDGTFWGSFAFWRTYDHFSIRKSRNNSASHTLQRTTTDGTTIRSERIRTSTTRTSEGSSEYSRVAAGQARLRLDLEREERLVELNARVARRRATLENMDEEGCNDNSSANDEKESEKRAPTGPTEMNVKGKGKAVGTDD